MPRKQRTSPERKLLDRIIELATEKPNHTKAKPAKPRDEHPTQLVLIQGIRLKPPPGYEDEPPVTDDDGELCSEMCPYE